MKRQTKIVPTQKGEPRFIYTSSCCNAQATKTPCLKVDKKAAETQGLGRFRCPTCRKPAKVSRSKNPLDKGE
jgi:hypothetical protein